MFEQMLWSITRIALEKSVEKGVEGAISWFGDELKRRKVCTEKHHKFDDEYKGSVLIKIKNLKKKSPLVIWWGEWFCDGVVLQPKDEQYIHLTQGGGQAWPLTVVLEFPASIEFIQNCVNVSDKLESQEGGWRNK
ncbi:MAG: hypothetical protein AB4041_02895 [Microcystaceae cyanobacterium]